MKTANNRITVLIVAAFFFGTGWMVCPTYAISQEPTVNVPAKEGDPEKAFAFHSFSAENGSVMLFRFKVSTGEGWLLSGSPGSKWLKLEEPVGIPIAKYDFAVAGKIDAQVFRFNRATGDTWHLVKGSWQLAAEAKAK